MEDIAVHGETHNLLLTVILKINSRQQTTTKGYGLRYGFNATVNNISAMSWRSVLLVKETQIPAENHQPVSSHTENHQPVSSHTENHQPVSSHTENHQPVSSRTENHQPVSSHTQTLSHNVVSTNKNKRPLRPAVANI